MATMLVFTIAQLSIDTADTLTHFMATDVPKHPKYGNTQAGMPYLSDINDLTTRAARRG